MTQLLDDLRAIDALFVSPHNWTKGEFARTAEGKSIGVRYPDAVCWCLAGARDHVIGEYSISRYTRINYAITGAAGVDPAGGYTDWNDDPCRSFADIKAVLARAIATEEGRAA